MDRRHAHFLALAVVAAAVSCYGNEKFNSYATVATAEEEKPMLQFRYAIVDKRTNIPCTLANMSITLDLGYNTKNNEIATRKLQIPRDAEVTGDCASTATVLAFTWGKKNEENMVKFVLFNDHTYFSLFSVVVDIYLDPENFPDAADTRLYRKSENDLGLFNARTDDGRHTCLGETKIKVNEYVNVTMIDLSLIAFNTMEDYSSRKEITCKEQTRIKAFPYSIEHLKGTIKFLTKMRFSMDVSYVMTNDSIKKVTIPFHNYALSTGYLNSGRSQLYGSLMLTWWNKENYTFIIDFSILETREAVLYIRDVKLNLILEKEFLNNAKDRLIREGTWRFNLFPMKHRTGLYSCPVGTTLRLGDVGLTISDVLLTTDDGDDFSSKQVIDCRTQNKITEKDFNYVVKVEGQDVPCILANMSISMRIRYPIATDYGFANLTVPSDAKAEGFCDHSMSKMVLTWVEPGGNQQSNKFALYLSRNSDQFSVYFVEADIYFDKENFPNATYMGTRFRLSSKFNLNIFAGPPQNVIYQCTDDSEVQIENAMVTISNVTLVPFNEQEDMNLNLEYVCSEKGTTIEPPITTPDASESDYMYVVRYTDRNAACILANMTISLKIRYSTKDSATKETILNVPSEKVETEGKCDCRNPSMTLVWSEDHHADADTQNRVTLRFLGDDNYFFLRSILVDLYLDVKNFPSAENSRFNEGRFNLELFSTPTRRMQRCDLETVIEQRNLQVTFNNVALIAFNTDSDVSNKNEFKCQSRNAPSQEIAAYVSGSIVIVVVIVILVGRISKRFCSTKNKAT